MAHAPHEYRTTLEWSGSTAEGYEQYSRTHHATFPPADDELDLSADERFKGDPTLLNPEALLVQAASSCQLLSFLAVAARARIDVVGYADEADGCMPLDERPIRITRIVLHPRITVVEGPSEQRVLDLCEVAHRECFIANSLTTEVAVEPTVTFVPAS